MANLSTTVSVTTGSQVAGKRLTDAFVKIIAGDVSEVDAVAHVRGTLDLALALVLKSAEPSWDTAQILNYIDVNAGNTE